MAQVNGTGREMKDQENKSAAYKSIQPKNIEKNSIQMIMLYDLCGWGGNRIAEAVSMTASRVSIIRNSPLYIQQRDSRREELRQQVLSKQSDKVVNDPVEERIKSLALDAIHKKEELLNAKSEFVQNSASSDILDRAGYKPGSTKQTLSIEVSEKMASRLDRIADYDDRGMRVKIKTEVEE